MFSVQLGAALAKALFPIAGPLWTATLRICFSACMLVAAFRPRLRRLHFEQWRWVIPYGVTLGGMNLFFYSALSRIPLGLAVAIEFSGPLLVALLGSHRKLDLLWALLAAAGIVLITPAFSAANVNGAGVLFALMAASMWALYIVVGRRVSQHFAGSEGVAIGMLIASLVSLAVVAVSRQHLNANAHILLTGAEVALLSSALPYTLEMIALRVVPAKTFGILMSLEPAVAAACGWFLLSESLAASQLAAICLVIAASAGTTLTGSRKMLATEV